MTITPKHRLREFIEFKNMRNSVFERMCDLGNGFCSTDGNINYTSVRRITAAFPELNINWVLTGKGEMLNKITAPPKAALQHATPIYNNIEDAADDNRCGGIELAAIKNDILFVQFNGNSMTPTIASGSYLGLRHVKDYREIETGRCYAVRTQENFFVRIINNVSDEYLSLSSPNENYGGLEIMTKNIIALYIVEHVLTLSNL